MRLLEDHFESSVVPAVIGAPVEAAVVVRRAVDVLLAGTPAGGGGGLSRRRALGRGLGVDQGTLAGGGRLEVGKVLQEVGVVVDGGAEGEGGRRDGDGDEEKQLQHGGELKLISLHGVGRCGRSDGGGCCGVWHRGGAGFIPESRVG